MRQSILLINAKNDNLQTDERSGNLKITIDINEEIKDTEIEIHCNGLSQEIEKILATLRILNQQMMATSIVIPVMMIFSFVPMLAMFNETIKKIGCVFYTLQLSDMLNKVSHLKIELGQILVFVITLFVSIILFVYAYKKCGLE